jgi:hypothetical protein
MVDADPPPMTTAGLMALRRRIDAELVDDQSELATEAVDMALGSHLRSVAARKKLDREAEELEREAAELLRAIREAMRDTGLSF